MRVQAGAGLLRFAALAKTREGLLRCARKDVWGAFTLTLASDSIGVSTQSDLLPRGRGYQEVLSPLGERVRVRGTQDHRSFEQLLDTSVRSFAAAANRPYVDVPGVFVNPVDYAEAPDPDPADGIIQLLAAGRAGVPGQ